MLEQLFQLTAHRKMVKLCRIIGTIRERRRGGKEEEKGGGEGRGREGGGEKRRRRME